MVLSLKPFGCMPSTQSDGAQSAVVSNFKDMIYLPIETSGEGEINAHSRVQMALGEAKDKAKTGDSPSPGARPALRWTSARLRRWKRIRRLQAPDVQGPARQGRGRHRPRTSSCTSLTSMKAEARLARTTDVPSRAGPRRT